MKKGDSQPLQEAVGSCVSEKAGVDQLCERGGSLSCGRHCCKGTRPEGPPVRVVNVDSQCEILSVFT